MEPRNREEQRVRSLLAPYDRVEAVRLRSKLRPRRAPAALALVISVVAVSSAAIAAVVGPFPGLSNANRPADERDALSAEVVAQFKASEPPGGRVDQIGKRVLDSARLVGTLPSGRKVYAITSTKGRLCVAIEGLSQSCGMQLSDKQPITLTIVDSDGLGGEPPLAYGVARDDVRSVAFTVSGRPITARVSGNLYYVEATPLHSYSSFSAPTVTFTDGRMMTIG